MRYLIYLLVVFSTSAAAGTIQKWVDEDGNVHYGDAPPVSAKTKEVRVQSAPSDPGKPLPRLTDDQGGESANAGGGGDDGTSQQQNSEEDAITICENARADLDILNNNTNIQLKLADGTTRALDTVEVNQRRAKAQAEIERYCK